MPVMLVLIVMALGAMTIPSFLNYTVTAQKAASVTVEDVQRQYAADAAVELSLWRLRYNVDGILDNLTLENPSLSYSVTVNGIEVPYTVSVSESGEGGEPGPMPPTESGIHLEALLEIDPGWAPAGQPVDFTYVVHARNYGESAIHLKGILQILPPDFQYIPGTYGGPPNPVFTEAWVTDHWELTWMFTSPKPRIDSGASYPIPFDIRGFLDTGAYNDFGEGFVYYSAFGEEEELSVGTLGLAMSVGLYDFTVSAASYQVQVNAGLYDSGAKVNSYQVD